MNGAGEEELAAREFVAHLRKLVVAILAAHAQRMLAHHPGEVVHALVDLVVDGERAAGGLPKLVRLLLSWMFGTPQEFLSVTLNGHADLRIHILHAGQLLAR